MDKHSPSHRYTLVYVPIGDPKELFDILFRIIMYVQVVVFEQIVPFGILLGGDVKDVRDTRLQHVPSLKPRHKLTEE